MDRFVLRVVDAARGDGQRTELGGFTAVSAPPLLWAGLIPPELIAQHLAPAPGDGSPEEREPATGVFGVDWPTARRAYRARVADFLLEQPGCEAFAMTFFERVEEIALTGDNPVLEIDLSSWRAEFETGDAYIEQFGSWAAPWMWPGQGLGAGHRPVLPATAFGYDLNVSADEHTARAEAARRDRVQKLGDPVLSRVFSISLTLLVLVAVIDTFVLETAPIYSLLGLALSAIAYLSFWYLRRGRRANEKRVEGDPAT